MKKRSKKILFLGISLPDTALDVARQASQPVNKSFLLLFSKKKCLLPYMLKKRSFALAGHRTSVALEPEFWEVLEALARARDCRLAQLVAQADAARDPATPLASVLRVMALHSSRY